MAKEKNKSKRWFTLDNAAMIYPAAMSRRWNATYRVSATLNERIDPKILQKALQSTVNRFPTFALKLKSGLFWHYLEHIDGAPAVEPDVANPCVYFRLKEGDGFMFRVRYHENRIAIEVFHVLADGSGGMSFLKTLVAEYIRIKHGVKIPRDHDIKDCNEKATDEEIEDSFDRYARKETLSRSESGAYHLTGTPAEFNYLNITTGIVPSDKLYQTAKKYGASVTEFLVSALIMSIYEIQKGEISKRKRKQRVKVCVPVNLRQFYPSKTVRNFSSFINIGINPAFGEYTFEETLKRIQHLIGLDASEKMINARMSKNVSDENNPVLRAIPLFIKNTTLKLMFWLNGDRLSSTTLTNLGVVKLPDEMSKYVDRFDFILGPMLYNPVTCACGSYNNKLVITFSRTIKETDVERNFFTFLVKLGVPVIVESNRRYD